MNRHWVTGVGNYKKNAFNLTFINNLWKKKLLEKDLKA